MPYFDRGRWRSDIQINGRRFSRSFVTKKEAIAWASEKRNQSTRGSDDMVLAELMVKYLDYCELQFMPETYKLKKNVMGRLLDGVNCKIPVSRVTRAMIYEHLKAQMEKRSPAVVNEDRKHINAMYNWARYIYDIQNNPVAGIKKFKAEPKDLYTPPEEDVLKVLALAEGEGKVFLYCYLLTGAREQEINRLRWKDVDFDQGRICLWSRKTKSRELEAQWIDMAPVLASSLLWWKNNRPMKDLDHVFINDQRNSRSYGKPYRIRAKLLRNLCRRAGVTPFGFHSMRRYVGSILAKEGVPMQVIQGVLRHKTLAHTERYVRGLGIDMTKAVQQLEDRLAGESTTKVPTKLRLVK